MRSFNRYRMPVENHGLSFCQKDKCNSDGMKRVHEVAVVLDNRCGAVMIRTARFMENGRKPREGYRRCDG